MTVQTYMSNDCFARSVNNTFFSRFANFVFGEPHPSWMCESQKLSTNTTVYKVTRNFPTPGLETSRAQKPHSPEPKHLRMRTADGSATATVWRQRVEFVYYQFDKTKGA